MKYVYYLLKELIYKKRRVHLSIMLAKLTKRKHLKLNTTTALYDDGDKIDEVDEFS